MEARLTADFQVVPSSIASDGRTVVIELGFGTSRPGVVIERASWLVALEAVFRATRLESAHREVDRLLGGAAMTELLRRGAIFAPGRSKIHIGGTRMVLITKGPSRKMAIALDPEKLPGSALLSLVPAARLKADAESLRDLTTFLGVIEELRVAGLIAEAPGQIDWGDLRRRWPVCPRFGYSRGTPIDRYYLRRFLEEHHALIAGTVVELGGDKRNPASYRMEHVDRYLAMEREPGSTVDVAGDVHDERILPASSADCVLAFFVLEHCARPWQVVDNIWLWLKSGGNALVAVPNAQRRHQMPDDFWRPMPSAMAMLFERFTKVQVVSHGNPELVIASFLGLAAEEMSAESLGRDNPDYPVVTFVVATK